MKVSLLVLYFLFFQQADAQAEDHPALSASCSIEWVEKYEDRYHRLHAITDVWPRSNYPLEVPQTSVTEPHLNPEPKTEFEPEPTSTNTFSTPGYGSDVIEIDRPLPVTSCHGTTIIIDDGDTLDPNVTMKHMNIVSPILDSTEFPRTEALSLDRPLSVVYGDHGTGPAQAYADDFRDPMVKYENEACCGLEYTDDDDDDSDQAGDEEEGTEDDEDQSESRSSGSSELEFSETSSISYTTGGIQFGFSSGLDAYASSSDPEYNGESVCDSNAESANESEDSSDVDSDDQISVSHYDRYIDPSLLAQQAAQQTGVNEFKTGNDIDIDIKQQVKNEFTDYKPKLGAITDRRARFPKLEISPSNTSLPVDPPIPSFYSTSPGAYQHTLFCEPPQIRYTDGPFLCKEGLREETGTNEGGPKETEIRSVGANGNAIKRTGSQESVKEEMAPVAEVSLKRKAVEMDSQSSPIFESTNIASQQSSAETSKSQPAVVMASVSSETEPPRKRAKSNHSPASKVASYTATAVISALLGGLGTIALLAFLPPEYFQ